MNGNLVRLAMLATVVLLFGYEAVVAVAQRRRPDRMARNECTVHERRVAGANDSTGAHRDAELGLHRGLHIDVRQYAAGDGGTSA